MEILRHIYIQYVIEKYYLSPPPLFFILYFTAATNNIRLRHYQSASLAVSHLLSDLPHSLCPIVVRSSLSLGRKNPLKLCVPFSTELEDLVCDDGHVN